MQDNQKKSLITDERRLKLQRLDVDDVSKTEYTYICEECMLNEDECKILEMKLKKKSIQQMADTIHKSTATCSRIIRRVKKKIAKLYEKNYT